MTSIKNLLTVIRQSRPTSPFHPSKQQFLLRQGSHHSSSFRAALLPHFTRSFYTSQEKHEQHTSVQRQAHVRSRSTPDPSPSTIPLQDPIQPPEEQPTYQLTFTCKPCGQRSTHRISKHGYHRGAVLISCPGCQNRHVISDHLGFFADKTFTLEDILKQRGDQVKRGTLGANGDVEFWPDEHDSESTQKNN